MPLTNTSPQFDAVIKTPFCYLGLRFENKELISTEYLPPDSGAINQQINLKKTEVVDVLKQIQSYINVPSSIFKLPVKTQGTEFQQRVWRRLAEIPAGTVVTYGELAKELSSAAQAVGNACRANHTPLIVPCHRVVSATGIGGFAGSTSGYLIDIKRQLLRHEGLEF